MRSKLLEHFSRLCALLLLLVAVPALADPSSCDLALKRLNDDLVTAMGLVHQISPALVNGEKTPAWTDFALLQNLIDKVQAGKRAAMDAGKAEELKAAIDEIGRSIQDDPQLTALRDASKGVKLANQYEPGEYELKLEYQQLLSKLNHQLPKELRIPGVRLPHDPRNPVLIAQAKQLLLKQEARFEPYLSHSGFASLDDLRAALDSFDDTAKKLALDLDSENVEFAMNRPEGARWWVPRTGFQNQRITGSSRGSFNIPHRNNVEATMTGQDLTQYVETDNQFKPVYGYLKPVPGQGLNQSPAAQHYGSDVYIFKKDHVRNRLTWTAGDSFGPAGFAPKTPDAAPANWRGFFIPWKYRLLIAPDVLDQVETARIGFVAQTPQLPKGIDLPKAPIAPPQPVLPMISQPVMPQPDLPALPVAPPGPKLITLPPAPPAPVQIKLEPPMMPPLKDGEKFETALGEFQNSDVVKQYQAETQRLNSEYQSKWAAYQQSDEMKAYQAKAQEINQANQKLQQEYMNSDAYKAYQQQYQLIQQEQQKITQEFQQSDKWKAWQEEMTKYNAEVQRINAEYQTTWQTYINSPEYKSFEAAQQEYNAALIAARQSDAFKWFNYNRSLNPYAGFAGTSLGPFRAPQAQGYIELQYWGPVTLDDVETFEFRGNPPSGEFLKELRKRGISIRDGRQDPAVDWNP